MWRSVVVRCCGKEPEGRDEGAFGLASAVRNACRYQKSPRILESTLRQHIQERTKVGKGPIRVMGGIIKIRFLFSIDLSSLYHHKS